MSKAPIPINITKPTFSRAVVIVLHRPYVLVAAGGSILKEEDLWQADSYPKAKTAATNFNGVLERLIDADMVKCLKPLTYLSASSNQGSSY